MKHHDPDYRLRKHLDALVRRISPHWMMVNLKLPPLFPLIVLSDVDVETFSALPEAVEPLNEAMRKRVMDRKIAFATLKMAKRSLYARMRWFRMYMLAFYQKSAWLAALPVLPQVQSGADEFLDPMQKAEFLWEDIAPLPPPVPGAPAVMHDGYGAAEFAAEVAQVVALWRAFRRAELLVRLARGALLVFYRRAAAAIAAYGHVARGRLMPGDPLLASIPRLWKQRVRKAGDFTF